MQLDLTDEEAGTREADRGVIQGEIPGSLAGTRRSVSTRGDLELGAGQVFTTRYAGF